MECHIILIVPPQSLRLLLAQQCITIENVQMNFCCVLLRKEMVDEGVVLKNPSEAVEEVETLAEEFYNKPLILEKGNINNIYYFAGSVNGFVHH